MNTKGKKFIGLVMGAFMIAVSAIGGVAQQVQCSSEAGRVDAVTNPDGHIITTKFQFDNPNLQPLLTTTITMSRRGCIVAHLSGLARITDNYVVFQVRVDGVPMKGHTFLPGFPATPVVFRAIDANPQFDDEQFIDPTKVISHNFFDWVAEGTHTIEVMGAAGSNIIAGNEPRVNALVLTLEHP